MENKKSIAPQSLKLAPDIFDQLNIGKRVTIRKGRRDIQLGVLDFECTSGVRGKTVKVTQVLYTHLANVPEQDVFGDGFSSLNDLFNTMRRFYPDIDWNSEVTVVRFINIL